MKIIGLGLCVSLCILMASSAVRGDEPAWASEMQWVHSNFTGTPGTIARFGDSITTSNNYSTTPGFFLPLRNSYAGTTSESQAALDWLHSYAQPKIWDWWGSNYGAQSGTQSSWAMGHDNFSGMLAGETNIHYWLRTENPEMAVIMWGTNDILNGVSTTTYKNRMRQVVQACIDNGTIPLLTTIPPLNGAVATSDDYAQTVRDLATEMKVPLIDFHQAVLTYGPNGTWLPNLICDGVHPSNSVGSFSDAAMKTSGYDLRNYITLMEMKDVYDVAIVPEPVSAVILAVGGILLLRKRTVRPGA